MSKFDQDPKEIITVRSDIATQNPQQSPLIGISANTAGTKKISMILATIPPNITSEPHFHSNYETAIYFLKVASKLAMVENSNTLW
ncbi:hypothetical protein AVDCRST_MAG81-4630 [uncultured Synechococcales cyanobacterium]|uniref:Cupin type-1 domain-containing protein n=1 Tax=uncultured Synechococcales cyanobacterium TaxID=1936017 RepID=A0A6J4VV37_9CYAN|nr:hypothetical protein AVDCRST_MAG81-4630 [uncultured Synechococcales cyanobacterium]